jgi:hypothetical protein
MKFRKSKIFKITLRIFSYLAVFLIGFYISLALASHFGYKERQVMSANGAIPLLGAAELLREGEVEKAINIIEQVINMRLAVSVWRRDMNELDPMVLDAWQRAKTYYDKYKYGQYSNITPHANISNKLEQIPWPYRERLRRNFISEYKGKLSHFC